jgi:hypothetical protein
MNIKFRLQSNNENIKRYQLVIIIKRNNCKASSDFVQQRQVFQSVTLSLILS